MTFLKFFLPDLPKRPRTTYLDSETDELDNKVEDLRQSQSPFSSLPGWSRVNFPVLEDKYKGQQLVTISKHISFVRPLPGSFCYLNCSLTFSPLT